ncbi:nephrocystin-3 protein [Ceratobasidium sp. AG-Ba]|nr:nephrocystin-3 protein [Ceratobasidium sp. AG-Ba]
MTSTSELSIEDELVINAMSLDGGGILSLLSLLTIIEEIMKRVQRDRKLEEVPLPSQHFRFIIGAGFASLLAVMFGRLRLSVDDTKKHCSSFIRDVFSKRKLIGQGKFKSRELKAAIERMLEACGVGQDARMLDSQLNDADVCKAIVCAGSEHAELAGGSICFRTYSAPRNGVPDCTIVEALCAALSLPGLFKPAVIIEPGDIAVSYVGLCNYNPTVTLLEELPLVFPDGKINCLVNAGARYKGMTGTTGESTAEGLERRFQDIPGSYFRFYVQRGVQDIGISEWKKQSPAVAHTRSYLSHTKTDERIKGLVDALSNKGVLIPTIHARDTIFIAIHWTRFGVCTNGEIPLGKLKRAMRVRPLRTWRCWEDTVGISIFVQVHKKRYKNVFYIDASSSATIEADLKSIALVKKAGGDPNDALTWLADNGAQSLLVYNNADDTQLDLSRYFPACSQVNILVTTRNYQNTGLACDIESQLHIRDMSKQDARKLLAKAAGISENLDCAAESLLKELGYFALAIVQAGAYIRNNSCTVSRYLEMYLEDRGQLLEEYAQTVPKLDNYDLTVYATWRVSYAKIPKPDQQFYNMMAFMHHEHIPEEIFQLAALSVNQYKSTLPLSNDEHSREQGLSRVLSRFQRPDGGWDKAVFFKSIRELRAYSLIDINGADGSYSIHPLVQQWARSEVADSQTVRSYTALLLASCVTPDHKSKDYAFRKMLLNHLDALPVKEKAAPQIAGRTKTVYYEAGRYNEAEQLVEGELQAKTDRLGGKHLSTLRCKAWKASILSKQGRWDDARALQQQVLDVIEQVGGKTHPYTLTTKASLADTYRNQGLWVEAENLGREVVALSREILGDKHCDTTTRMGNLACTLWKQRKWGEAEALDREVIEIKKQLYGEDHQDTQTSIANLATALWSQGRVQEAKDLHEEVLEVSKRVRGADHPHTLKCMNNLASAYWSSEMWQEGEELQKEVVEITRKVQGEDHPQTLKSMANLAEMHRHQKRWKDAEALEREVVKLRRQKLGDRHPDTIKSIANLALTCRGLGQLSEAENLMESAVDASKSVLGDAHRYTVSRTKWLESIRRAVQKEAKGRSV